MTFRAALESVWHPLSASLHPTNLQRVGRALDCSWAENPAQAPPPFELEKIVERIGAAWHKEQSLLGVKRPDRRWLHCSLYFPPDRPDAWLGSEKAFVKALLAEVAASPRLLAATVHQALLRYPKDLENFSILREGLARLVQGTDSIRVREWRRRAQTYHLLKSNGPALLVKEIYSSPDPVADLLEDAGFKGELAAAEFLREVVRVSLKETEKALARQPEASQLERALSLVVSREESLRFPTDAHLIAHALLLPHINRSPQPGTAKRIEVFLVQHLRDPRFDPTRWQLVRTDARDVLLRWIVGATLEDFFRLISRNALERHWKYRHAFWRAYFKRDMIAEAWVVLGEEARATARGLWQKEPGHGVLTGTGDRAHCVLLMKVGGLTIAEWSHNGKCRVWSSDTPAAPKLYSRTYRREQLKGRADLEIVHQYAERYGWQRRLAGYIFRQTGCEIAPAEYRVR